MLCLLILFDVNILWSEACTYSACTIHEEVIYLPSLHLSFSANYRDDCPHVNPKGPWRSPVKCQPTFFRLPGTLFRTLLTISCFIPPKTSQNHNTVLEKGCLSPIDWIVSNIFNLLGRKEFHFQGPTQTSAFSNVAFNVFQWIFCSPYTSDISSGQSTVFISFYLDKYFQQRSKVLMDSSSKKGRFIDFVASKKEL